MSVLIAAKRSTPIRIQVAVTIRNTSKIARSAAGRTAWSRPQTPMKMHTSSKRSPNRTRALRHGRSCEMRSRLETRRPFLQERRESFRRFARRKALLEERCFARHGIGEVVAQGRTDELLRGGHRVGR